MTATPQRASTHLDTHIHMLLRAQCRAALEMMDGLLHEVADSDDQESIRAVMRWKGAILRWRYDIDREIAPEAVASFPPYLLLPELRAESKTDGVPK